MSTNLNLFDQLQDAITSTSSGKQDEEKLAQDVEFKYIDGPILHIQFMPGKLTETIFQNFINKYKYVFNDKKEKFVFLFDLRNIDAKSFQIEWVLEFITVLVSLREETARFIKGTAIYLPDQSDSFVQILQMFFNLYKTVRPHFASYKESEILDFMETCLFS